jgi:uncharacterized RDD family membrane protein YckC
VSEADELLSIDTPENVVFAYEVVGIGTRFIAALIDTVLLFVILVGIEITAGLLLADFVDLAHGWVAALFVGFSFAVFWGYYILFELMWNGQSPGKRWAGVRVVRRDGTPITLVESLIRNLVRVVDFMPVAYGLGIVTMFIHPQTCRLGDLAAGTLVVRDQGPLGLVAAAEQPVLRAYLLPAIDEQVGQWPLERLETSDIQLAREFMQRRHGLVNHDALAMTIVRRLLAKMGLPSETVRAADAPYVLASVVQACQER